MCINFLWNRWFFQIFSNSTWMLAIAFSDDFLNFRISDHIGSATLSLTTASILNGVFISFTNIESLVTLFRNQDDIAFWTYIFEEESWNFHHWKVLSAFFKIINYLKLLVNRVSILKCKVNIKFTLIRFNKCWKCLLNVDISIELT